MVVRPRELPGREVVQSLHQFEWRYQTLEQDRQKLVELQDPVSDDSPTQHRFTNRERLHEAERQLHHFLSGYYTFKCLVTTLAQSAPDPECTGRLKHQRDIFADKPDSRVILGMRHYVQHHNVLPVLVKNSALSTDFPKYAINAKELRMRDSSYRVPQMVIDVSEYDDGYNYFYEHVDNICVYPFQIISGNWPEVEELRNQVYEIVRTTLGEELSEYMEQLRELKQVREELQNEHDFVDEMLQEMEGEGVLPSIRELFPPEIYEQIDEE